MIETKGVVGVVEFRERGCPACAAAEPVICWGKRDIDAAASGGKKVWNMIARRKNQASGRGGYEPTPKDVRRACEEIQATWSPRERAKRAMIRLSELVEVINGERADSLPDVGAAWNKAER